MPDFNAQQLNAIYEEATTRFVVEGVFTRETVGGQPGGDDGLKAYIRHHLKITDEDKAEEAFNRIKGTELASGETITPPLGEVEEVKMYSLNNIRSDEFGSWIGDWMVKACFKAAASRNGLFVSTRGLKGDVAEMGRVQATGASLRNPAKPHQIYLTDAEGNPVKTFFQEFKGKVSTPQGSQSIVTTAECAPAGSCFSFEFRFKTNTKFKPEDVALVVASMQVIGLGSAKSLERGKFTVNRLSVDDKASKADKK